jgi:formamidase
MRIKPHGRVWLLAAAATVATAGIARADTTDQKWQETVVVAKTGDHCVDDSNCFNRYHYAIKPAARAKPGQMIVFETRDALDSDLKLDSVPADVTAIDLNLVR